MNNDLLNSLNDFTIKEENLFEKINKGIFNSFSETIDVEKNEIIKKILKKILKYLKKIFLLIIVYIIILFKIYLLFFYFQQMNLKQKLKI